MSTYLQLTADDEGIIYAINGLGELNYYRDKTHDGVSGFGSWVDTAPRTIGVGWNELTKVVAGGDGILYAVNAGGELLYYRDQARDGSQNWAHGGKGQVIGTGWDGFSHIVSGGAGVLYAVNANGELLYYRDQARDGTQDWAHRGTGKVIGTGWQGFSHIASGGAGVLYAVNANGDLMFYRDEARDGTTDWSFGGAGKRIGNGWGTVVHLLGGGGGILYATTATPLPGVPHLGGSNDFMYYYRDRSQNGSQNWSNSGTAQQIGSGW
jgi:hypothetical protein